MTARSRLPNRRELELLNFEHDGISYTGGVGLFENGALAEIFLNTRKHGTAVDVWPPSAPERRRSIADKTIDRSRLKLPNR